VVLCEELRRDRQTNAQPGYLRMGSLLSAAFSKVPGMKLSL